MRRFDVATFVWGVVFAIIGTVLALEAGGVWELRIGHARWLGPAAAIVIGLVLVVRATIGGKRGEPV